MAKLYRDATTDEYSIETAMDGEFVTLRVHPDGREFLDQQGVDENSRIPAEMFAVLEENGWIEVAGEGAPTTPARVDAPVVNESETNAPAGNVPMQTDEPLPSVRMDPRPWMEKENVDVMKSETEPTAADTEQPDHKSKWTSADRENADALRHPEAAAFVGGVWFWLLVVAAVVIIAWALIEFV